MLTHPEFDPVAVQIGDLKIHWYGLMYMVAFISAWYLGTLRARKADSGWKADEISDFMFYAALGVILGGRMGYVLFYDFSNFIDHPLVLFKIWQGGMSFHGGLLGSALAIWLYARKTKRGFFQVTDFTIPLFPLGYAAGRFGNFINGELWGRVTDVPWGMVFAQVGPEPRHPSQLYQFFLGGVLIFIIIWWYSSKPRPTMAVSGLFLALFGSYRIFVEFFRQPDKHLGFIAFEWMTMGQILSVPMVAVGCFMLWKGYQNHTKSDSSNKQAGAA